MTKTLALEIESYLNDLHGSTDVCQRPELDGTKCVQCREREGVIRKLESILREYYQDAPRTKPAAAHIACSVPYCQLEASFIVERQAFCAEHRR